MAGTDRSRRRADRQGWRCPVLLAPLAPQLLVVSFTRTAGVRARYAGPFDGTLRDAFFQRLDVTALAATVGR